MGLAGKPLLKRAKAEIFRRLPCLPSLDQGISGLQTAWRLTSQASPNKPLRVAVLFPWDDLLNQRSGASRRTGYVIDLLAASGMAVTAYSLGGRLNRWRKNVRYRFFCPQFPQTDLIKQAYQDAFLTWQQTSGNLPIQPKVSLRLPSDITDHWLPWIYYPWRYDPSFQDWIDQIIAQTDVVILEYPFWAQVVAPRCQQHQIPLLITAHDVLAKQLPENSWPAQVALTEELSALRQADQVVTLTTEDQAFFQQQGISSCCIPIALDIQQLTALADQPKTDALQQLQQFCSAKSWQKPFGLFVGSDFAPNREAVEHLLAISAAAANWDVVVAGGAAPEGWQGNLLGLGKVPESVLHWLYQTASLVMIPLQAGTGMSIKTLEALAFGKIILGTHVAFRGYPVQSQKAALIEDDLQRYPTIIDTIIANPDSYQSLPERAQTLAKTFDYRQRYQPYLDWVKSVC